MAFISSSFSNRKLQDRRYTTTAAGTLGDSQEAFASVLSIGSNEVFTDTRYIMTSSLPFSGSTQDGFITSASRVDSTLTGDSDLNVAKYWFQKKLTPGGSTVSGKYETWFFLTGSLSSVSEQTIDNSQVTNFLSPKFGAASIGLAHAENANPGYNVRVYITNTDSQPGDGGSGAVEASNYVFDYKTGVLSFVNNSVSPTTSQYVWMSAYQYVGRTLESQITDGTLSGGDTVSLHISASEGTGFSLANNATSSFESGSAGITVTATSATNKITIGASTDNVTFNTINASSINADLIEATQYIVSSSITYMTQSFSSGSTIFGDTNDDTHQFTGSISILHTGSGYGFELSGSSINIDAGSSGSLFLGTYNVGYDISSVFSITGSGLIVSQSNLPSNHYNMIKVGEIEMVDYTGGGNPSFLLDVKQNRAIVISSSNANAPIANIQANNTKFYDNSGNELAVFNNSQNKLFNSTNIELTPDSTLYLNATSNLNIRAGGTSDDGAYNSNKALFIGQSFTNSTLNLGTSVKPISLANIYPLFKGAITASAVSSSGLLFASLSGNPTHTDSIFTVVYDTGSGQFYYTGSYGAGGGDTTNLVASASAGIRFEDSDSGFSTSLIGTASFSASGPGLSIDVASDTITYTIDPDTLVAGTTDSSTFNFTSSQALTASKVNVVDIESAASAHALVFTSGGIDTGQNVQLATDASQLVYFPGSSILRTGTSTGTNNISLSPSALTAGASVSTFSLLNTDTTTINFGSAATTINIGDANGTVNIAGSASIAGNLIVQGTLTSINTTDLNVEDQFILLNSSSSDPDSDGGIVIQTDGNANGTALFYDNSSNRWALAQSSSVAWNDISATAHQYVVSVSQSAAAPTGNPSNFGLDDASRYGMMYVDTSDTTDGGLYIYLP